MDKETLKEKLLSEGFVNVYEWHDEPGTEYANHIHKGAVTFYILDGYIDLSFEDRSFQLKKDDRFDVPVGKEHSAKVGPSGCSFLVGEMIKGDS